jgi:NADH:ubiquinone oxidoreductase subunit 3 (subunit A)
VPRGPVSPIAVALNQVSFYGLLWAIIFIALLVDGLVYAWRKGALNWI